MHASAFCFFLVVFARSISACLLFVSSSPYTVAAYFLRLWPMGHLLEEQEERKKNGLYYGRKKKLVQPTLLLEEKTQSSLKGHYGALCEENLV
jgi:hypothetical protein